jgi:hypothetical protein
MVRELLNMQWDDHRLNFLPTHLSSSSSSSASGLNYLLTYAETGEKKNPQKKLLLVEPQYSTSDIQMKYILNHHPSSVSPLFCSLTHRVPRNDEMTSQIIELFLTVNFISMKNEKLTEYTPPPPPGLLTVPYDIFYPFIGNSAGADVKTRRLSSYYSLCSVLMTSVLYIIYI